MAAGALRSAAGWLRRQARPGALDEPGALVLAAATAAGALVPVAVPVAVAVGAAGLALLARRVLWVWCAAAVLTSALAAQAWAGLVPPEPAPFRGTVTLARDPEPAFGGWRVEVVAGDRRLEAWARGSAAGVLRGRSAGERVRVEGRVEAVESAPWLAVRHIAGRLEVDRVDGWDPGGPLARLANAARGVLRRSAEPLPADRRALFLGFVLGDDRGQPPEVADDFDAAGLQHLLVVSGQNVAFLLVVAGPVLRRMGLRWRLAATLVLLAGFATVTRFEPSVLRATAMAGIAALGATLGRPTGGRRALALAVAALLVADPFLVHSIGFQLSVAASAGILLWSGPIAAALPGPRALAVPLSVTLAAQAAVAPVLVPAFGPMPVAAVPANLLAEPVAGFVMMWGCSVGVIAGLVGGPVAGVLQWPADTGIAWVAWVARTARGLPLGHVGLPGLAAGASLVAVALVARRHARLGLAGLAAAAAVLVLAVGPSLVAPPGSGAGAGVVELPGADLWRGPSVPGGAPVRVLLLAGDADAGRVLEELRRRQVDRLDLIVLRSGGSRAVAALSAVRARTSVGTVWVPDGVDVPGGGVPTLGQVEAGGLRVRVTSVRPRLEVEVGLVDPGVGGPSAGAGTAAARPP